MEVAYTTYKTVYLHHTDGAVLVETIDGDDLWIPRSNIEDGMDLTFSDYNRYDEIELEVAEWFAIREGLV